MSELPTGYALRHATQEDAVAVAELVRAHDVADYGEPDFTVQDLLDDWMRPRFDLGQDSWVLHGPTGRIIGCAYLWEAQPDREFEGDAYVLPEYGGRGLGNRLLDLMEHRSREIADDRAMSLGVFASSVNVDKRNLLERRGYTLGRTVVRLRADLRREVEEPEPPPGVTIGAFDPADDEAVRAVWLEAYASHGRFSPRRMNEWLDLRFAHPAFDPSLWRVAKAGDEVVGVIFVFDVTDTGYTSTVALRSDARGRGIGPSLLRAAFSALRDRGQRRALVSLDADVAPRVVELYEAAGMRVHERHDLFVKSL
jgi:mycothiol synthase